ncbi:hypothetical protein F5B21DRAFT_357843 [Xylaria acuta]|nr:hypothetical protein F5B21DRAFT_357843 [Xylaria acuta]
MDPRDSDVGRIGSDQDGPGTDAHYFGHNTATWNRSEELLPHILKIKDSFEESVPKMGSHSSKENFTKPLLFSGERSDFNAAKPLFETALRVSDEPGSNLDEVRADVLFALSALSAQINEDKMRILEYAHCHLDCRKKG